MRIKFLAFAASLLLISNSSVGIPQTPSAAPSAPQRDPQALTVIAQMTAATGWTTGSIPPTIVASGTLTRPGASPQAPESFVLKQRGSTQHRFDLQNNGSTSTTIVNGLAGVVILPDGTTQRLLAHAAFSMQSPAFPFLTDLSNSSDPAVEVADLGTTTIEGAVCKGIIIARHAPSGDPLGEFRDLAAPLKIWLSEQTGLPVRIDFIRLALDNHFVAMHFSRSFSDYRVVNGVAVAFAQEEHFEDQLMYQIQFTSVQFGAAIADSDFDLPKH